MGFLESGILTETIDGDRWLRLRREFRVIRTPDGQKLMATRRRPASGPPPRRAVILIHGLAQNRYTWDLTGRSLSAYLVSHGYDVWNLELRGHGLSRIAGSTYPKDYREYVELDVPAAIREVRSKLPKGGSKLFLIGHSLGGIICYCEPPEVLRDVTGVVTIGSPASFGRGSSWITAGSKVLHWLHGRTALKNLSIPYLPADFAGLLLLWSLEMHEKPGMKLPIRLWTPTSMEDPILAERLLEGFDRTSLRVLEQLIRWAATGKFQDWEGRIDYEANLGRIRTPFLFIAGDRDTGVPLASVKPGYEILGSPDKTIKEFRQTGEGELHFGHVDLICGKQAPVEVWPFILDWLEKR